MCQAISKVLTTAVREAYRRAGGDVESAVYTPTDDLREIFAGLQTGCEMRTHEEKEEATV